MASRSHKLQQDRYSEKEAQERFEAALRGARTAGHKQMSELQGKKVKPSRSKSPRKRKPVKKP